MKPTRLTRNLVRKLLLAAATMPLFASTCTERSIEFILRSGLIEELLDDRSEEEQSDEILDDIEDLFDDAF
jgi:hypothetical protein